MKFGLFFANAGPFAAPETFEALVRTADEGGFESIWTVEHVVVPVGYRSQYPYSRDGRMPGPANSPIGVGIEPGIIRPMPFSIQTAMNATPQIQGSRS